MVAGFIAGCYIAPVIRRLISLALLGGFIYVGATVKLGERTFFGHIANIWRADETQEMVEGVKEKGGPALKKVKRGVKAGWSEVNKNEAAPTGDGGPPLTQTTADAGAPK